MGSRTTELQAGFVPVFLGQQLYVRSEIWGNHITSLTQSDLLGELLCSVPSSTVGEAPETAGHRVEPGHSGPGASPPAKVCAHTPTQGHPRTQAGQE